MIEERALILYKNNIQHVSYKTLQNITKQR